MTQQSRAGNLRPVKGFVHFYSTKSEDDKNEYDRKNGKIVSASRAINSLNSQDSAISMSYILMKE